MTIRIAAPSIRLVAMPTMGLLMAFCAPTTSLLRRDMSSPVLVLVKNLNDMRCKRENNPERKS